MDNIFKSYKHQYIVYAELLEKRKGREARAKLDELVPTLNLHGLNINGDLSIPLELANSH